MATQCYYLINMCWNPEQKLSLHPPEVYQHAFPPRRCERISDESTISCNYWYCTGRRRQIIGITHDIQTFMKDCTQKEKKKGQVKLCHANIMWVHLEHPFRIIMQKLLKGCYDEFELWLWKWIVRTGTPYHILLSAWPYFVFAQVSAVARILFPMATLEPVRWAALKGSR